MFVFSYLTFGSCNIVSAFSLEQLHLNNNNLKRIYYPANPASLDSTKIDSRCDRAFKNLQCLLLGNSLSLIFLYICKVWRQISYIIRVWYEICKCGFLYRVSLPNLSLFLVIGDAFLCLPFVFLQDLIRLKTWHLLIPSTFSLICWWAWIFKLLF